MAGTMKVAAKVADHKVELIETPIPEPSPGQIVVRTTMTTICGSDLHVVDDFPMNPDLVPQGLRGIPLGHEAVGIVHAVGEGVQNFRPGDRVATSAMVVCGRCEQCLSGDGSACTGGGGVPRGYQAEYYVIPFADVAAAKVPDELTDEQAVATTDIMSTGFAAIERADLRIGDSVAIFAQGPIGLCATAGARACGAGLIIAVESVPERIKASQAFGANIVINPQETDAVAEIMRLTDGRGVDVAVEAVGLQATFEAATRVTRRGGTVSSVGVYAQYPTLSLPTAGVSSFIHRRIVMTLCPGGHDRVRRLFNIQRYGNVDLRPIFTHRMRLHQIAEAYELFRARQDGVLKIAITP